MSRNVYDIPIDLSGVSSISFKRSPAHIKCISKAVDFLTPQQLVNVCAAADGTVRAVDVRSNLGGNELWYDEFGNYILIEHPCGEFSVYEHLTQNGLVVKVGDEVKADQLIGYSGATGYLGGLGPHLHFDVHVYTRDMNDMPDPKKFSSREEYFNAFPYQTIPITFKDPRKLMPLLPDNEKLNLINLIGNLYI
jgi:murein DD-endopeptidase MepM/ murein hydrolase activator NlpD